LKIVIFLTKEENLTIWRKLKETEQKEEQQRKEIAILKVKILIEIIGFQLIKSKIKLGGEFDNLEKAERDGTGGRTTAKRNCRTKGIFANYNKLNCMQIYVF
jgi:hypothetical protein